MDLQNEKVAVWSAVDGTSRRGDPDTARDGAFGARAGKAVESPNVGAQAPTRQSPPISRGAGRWRRLRSGLARRGRLRYLRPASAESAAALPSCRLRTSGSQLRPAGVRVLDGTLCHRYRRCRYRRGTADQFHFVYQVLTGDGEITAHVMMCAADQRLGEGRRDDPRVAHRPARGMPRWASDGCTWPMRSSAARRLRRDSADCRILAQPAGMGKSCPLRRFLLRGLSLARPAQLGVKISFDTILLGAIVYAGLAATSFRLASSSRRSVLDGSLGRPEGATVESAALSVHHHVRRPDPSTPRPVPCTLEAVVDGPRGAAVSGRLQRGFDLDRPRCQRAVCDSLATSTPATYS